jgi:hypothetical protein
MSAAEAAAAKPKRLAAKAAAETAFLTLFSSQSPIDYQCERFRSDRNLTKTVRSSGIALDQSVAYLERTFVNVASMTQWISARDPVLIRRQ